MRPTHLSVLAQIDLADGAAARAVAATLKAAHPGFAPRRVGHSLARRARAKAHLGLEYFSDSDAPAVSRRAAELPRLLSKDRWTRA